MAEKPMKGEAGENTGAKTRASIERAQRNGCTLTEIAKLAKRSVSVISSIKSGDIANPPSDVAGDIQKGCREASANRK